MQSPAQSMWCTCRPEPRESQTRHAIWPVPPTSSWEPSADQASAEAWKPTLQRQLTSTDTAPCPVHTTDNTTTSRCTSTASTAAPAEASPPEATWLVPSSAEVEARSQGGSSASSQAADLAPRTSSPRSALSTRTATGPSPSAVSGQRPRLGSLQKVNRAPEAASTSRQAKSRSRGHTSSCLGARSAESVGSHPSAVVLQRRSGEALSA
mmetsp:Transcript_65863/g.166849  ORF Transcript_65863/g.166849 Transcript_65863/m.166849 type:complete len:209 (-) Transcript_65863:136-762(-)